MEKSKFSSTDIANIVMKLNGEIAPIGETNTDSERYNNLIKLENTIDMLLSEMDDVCKYSNRLEYSMSKAGTQSIHWLRGIYEWLGDILSDYEDKPEDKQDLGDNNE